MSEPTYAELEIRIKALEQWTEERTSQLMEKNEQLNKEIKERKRIENELRESEEKCWLLVKYAPSGIFEFDLINLRFISVNDVMCEYTGFTKKEFLSMSPSDILTGESKNHYNDMIEKLCDGKKVPDTVELKIRGKNGRKYWVILNIRLHCENGTPKTATAVVHNITERKRMEKALRMSEEKYRTILENIEEGYFEVDLAGNIIFINDAICRIGGYQRDELMGSNNRDYMDEETAKEVFKAFNKVYTTGKPAKYLECEMIKKNKTSMHLETSASLIKDPRGRRIGFRGIIRDVNERKLAEKAKKRLEVQLQQSLKMESLGTLAGGIAHDFNNLLMGVQGRTSLILLDTDPSHPNFVHLTGIEEYVKSAAELTKQLIGFARYGKYQVKPTNINEILDRTSKIFGRAKKQISIHRKYEKKIWTVGVEQGQIEQVLMNLFVNAWQAMPGGGDLYLQTENVMLDENFTKAYTLEPGKYVKISIMDTGVGMDETTLQRIFEPFFTTKTMGRGTGLGLAAVYGIIKSHEGIIDVESERTKGSTFRLYLPVSEMEIKEETDYPKEVLKGTETILLVDDEDMIIDVGKELFETLGYEVLIAKGGEEAVKIYYKNRYKIDIVVLDMIMPGYGGSETFDMLREINPKIKVLLSSGYSIDGQATKILNRGCDGFIQKPFNMMEMSIKLREILDK